MTANLPIRVTLLAVAASIFVAGPEVETVARASAAPSGHRHAATHHSTGTIRVRVVDKDSGKPEKDEYLCPTRRKKNGSYKTVGKCGKTGKRGVAILRKCWTGRDHVTFMAAVGPFDYPHKVRVRAGRVTKVTWHQPMLG